jgi:hypothetical protein
MTEGVLDWRPVVGHEDFYEVSDYGHVKRTKRVKGARVGRCLHPAAQNQSHAIELGLRPARKSTALLKVVEAEAVAACSEADDPKSGYTCGECRSCIARELLAKAS